MHQQFSSRIVREDGVEVYVYKEIDQSPNTHVLYNHIYQVIEPDGLVTFYYSGLVRTRGSSQLPDNPLYQWQVTERDSQGREVDEYVHSYIDGSWQHQYKAVSIDHVETFHHARFRRDEFEYAFQSQVKQMDANHDDVVLAYLDIRDRPKSSDQLHSNFLRQTTLILRNGAAFEECAKRGDSDGAVRVYSFSGMYANGAWQYQVNLRTQPTLSQTHEYGQSSFDHLGRPRVGRGSSERFRRLLARNVTQLFLASDDGSVNIAVESSPVSTEPTWRPQPATCDGEFPSWSASDVCTATRICSNL